LQSSWALWAVQSTACFRHAQLTEATATWLLSVKPHVCEPYPRAASQAVTSTNTCLLGCC
jgi:hypothetical protein